MEKFICSFGMGTPLAGKYLEVEAYDINHCSDILRDQSFLNVVGSIYPEKEGLALILKHGWQKLPAGGKAAFANLDGVDWKSLSEQKQVLLSIANDRGRVTAEEQAALTGIIHLLDHIQDEASLSIGEKEVFGEAEEE